MLTSPPPPPSPPQPFVSQLRTSIKPPSKPILNDAANVDTKRQGTKYLQTFNEKITEEFQSCNIGQIGFPSTLKDSTEQQQLASKDDDKPVLLNRGGHSGLYAVDDLEKACNNFFEDIANDDFDNWNFATNMKEVTAKSPENLHTKVDMPPDVIHQTKETMGQCSSTTVTATAALPRPVTDDVLKKKITPSRSKFLAHVSPITLLSSNTGEFYRSSKDTQSKKQNSKPAAYLMISHHSGKLLSPSEINHVQVIQETPVISKTEQLKHIRSCGNEGTSSKCHRTPMPSVTNTFGTYKNANCIEKTPLLGGINEHYFSTNMLSEDHYRPINTSQNSVQRIMDAAGPCGSSCVNNKSASISASNVIVGVVVPKGGKVTPPLCRCGKRAKRKTVTTPGPNEGVPFYVCPNRRMSGFKRQSCGYFRWEIPPSVNAAGKPIFSDYGE